MFLKLKFLWGGKRAKIQHKTLIGTYENGGLKDVDILSKIKALQLSWIRRLFDKNDHAWKIIPKTILKKFYGSEKIFFPNLEAKIPIELPLFYKNIILNWCSLALNIPLTIECVYNHFNNTIFFIIG